MREGAAPLWLAGTGRGRTRHPRQTVPPFPYLLLVSPTVLLNAAVVPNETSSWATSRRSLLHRSPRIRALAQMRSGVPLPTHQMWNRTYPKITCCVSLSHISAAPPRIQHRKMLYLPTDIVCESFEEAIKCTTGS